MERIRKTKAKKKKHSTKKTQVIDTHINPAFGEKVEQIIELSILQA